MYSYKEFLHNFKEKYLDANRPDFEKDYLSLSERDRKLVQYFIFDDNYLLDVVRAFSPSMSSDYNLISQRENLDKKLLEVTAKIWQDNFKEDGFYDLEKIQTLLPLMSEIVFEFLYSNLYFFKLQLTKRRQRKNILNQWKTNLVDDFTILHDFFHHPQEISVNKLSMALLRVFEVGFHIDFSILPEGRFEVEEEFSTVIIEGDKSENIFKMTFMFSDYKDWDKSIYKAAKYFIERLSGLSPNVLLGNEDTLNVIDHYMSRKLRLKEIKKITEFNSRIFNAKIALDYDLPNHQFTLIYDPEAEFI